jgi:tight adherence protein B
MLERLDGLDITWIIGLFAAIAAVLVVEAFYITVFKPESYRDQVNRRLRIMKDSHSREEVLILLRRERGLTADGFYRLPIEALNRLMTQSGVTVSVTRLVAGMVLIGAIAFAGVFYVQRAVLPALGAALLLGPVAPILILRMLRKRRWAAFGARFPDALDIIVRSVKAGHPVPIAIAMVAREMPDPIGSEFGMLADEITYGSDLETAMRNMLARVGQEDLPLFVTAISIQSATGGNLTEILSNLSKVIRERFKMRRKIKALSSEGKFSAYALTALPILLFFAINAANPKFYGAIIHMSVTQYAIGATLVWMGIGNAIMSKMVNFRV